jgi:hypothetical protein
LTNPCYDAMHVKGMITFAHDYISVRSREQD